MFTNITHYVSFYCVNKSLFACQQRSFSADRGRLLVFFRLFSPSSLFANTVFCYPLFVIVVLFSFVPCSVSYLCNVFQGRLWQRVGKRPTRRHFFLLCQAVSQKDARDFATLPPRSARLSATHLDVVSPKEDVIKSFINF